MICCEEMGCLRTRLATMGNVEKRVEGLDYLAEAACLDALSDGGDAVVSN